MFLNIFRFNLKQRAGSLRQFRHRQIGVTLIRSLQQSVLNATPDTEIGIRPDADTRGNLIRSPESHAVHIIRHTIRIFL